MHGEDRGCLWSRARKGGALDHILVKQLRRRKQVLQQIIREKKSAVQNAPPGCMKFSCKKSGAEYYWLQPGAEKYTYLSSKKRDLAAALAQKQYDRQILKAAGPELKLIEKLLKMYEPDAIDAAYSKSPAPRRCLINPVWPSDEEFREAWIKQESCMKGFAEDAPEYYTEKGERVRSKSEIFIANMMYHLGVDYLFERRICLKGLGTIHPDFSVLDLKNRRTIIWEHLGGMDNPDYVEKAIYRINAYLKNGYVIGETLILTFETEAQPLNTREVERLIRHYFL
jgi:hypothetical protein